MEDFILRRWGIWRGAPPLTKHTRSKRWPVFSSQWSGNVTMSPWKVNHTNRRRSAYWWTQAIANLYHVCLRARQRMQRACTVEVRDEWQLPCVDDKAALMAEMKASEKACFEGLSPIQTRGMTFIGLVAKPRDGMLLKEWSLEMKKTINECFSRYEPCHWFIFGNYDKFSKELKTYFWRKVNFYGANAFWLNLH